MRQVLDLHIHSRYSRACSPKLLPENIEQTCRTKGVDVIATGDFTHPEWSAILKKDLEEIFPDAGLYKLKRAADDKVKFLLSTEVALIYMDGGRCRRIHLVVQAPNMSAVIELNRQLAKRFNIHSDGRPILGISAPEFVKLVLKINDKFLIYPAHIWTPWFSVFGSKSGFNTLEECFREQTEHIYAYETGLSSDPEMNWRLSALDNLTVLSNSDAHSLNNIAREANIMDIDEPVTYQKIYDIIKYRRRVAPAGTDREGMRETLEFYPEEGMYHLDGHRDCAFSCEPAESRRLKNICPQCGKPLVIGVLNRVEELADRPYGFRPLSAVGFRKTVELDKIIGEALGLKNRASVAVQKQYRRLTEAYGSEIEILLDLDLQTVNEEIDVRIIEGIRRVRDGELIIIPGFDGQYGQINIFSSADKSER
jgi:uncharacterized protein (TIGR00375 family)